ncbi:MAG: DUF1080 domain-containing protein, partial [Roseibacillus sp.]|nr:DUF1080 domain-containing protein [Roseibacillus sp.]
PFPPVAPNGRRSFPSKETTLGIDRWNHYYVRAIEGEVRIWVNGEEVSGGDRINPASGFLCLESEGAPIEFKNIRLRRLPPLVTALPEGLEIPVPVIENPSRRPGVSLKGHALLGTWKYLGSYTREFLADGRCILRNGDEVLWTKKAIEKTPASVTLKGGYQHRLTGEVLDIEGRYKATRRK